MYVYIYIIGVPWGFSFSNSRFCPFFFFIISSSFVFSSLRNIRVSLSLSLFLGLYLFFTICLSIGKRHRRAAFTNNILLDIVLLQAVRVYDWKTFTIRVDGWHVVYYYIVLTIHCTVGNLRYDYVILTQNHQPSGHF